jgi:hypothetical protein
MLGICHMGFLKNWFPIARILVSLSGYSPQLFQKPIVICMKSAGISELKATLKTRSQPQLLELCLRLARAKKENKELLTYLLYEADDQPAYINAVKRELDDDFAAINTGNLHWVKKSLRKILRTITKQVRYTGSTTAEIELLLHFCALIKQHRIPVSKSAALSNLYHNQLRKTEAAIKTMHEDLQRDYFMQLEPLRL